MTEVIPAIIAKSFDELEDKLKKVETFVDWVQIDISDGIYTPNVTWNNPTDLHNIKSSVNIEVHLMIKDPERHIAEWIDSGAKRIIVHVSSENDYQKISEIAKLVKERGLEFGIAITPEIHVESVEKIIPLVGIVLLLAVDPGFSGQKFQPIILEKIKCLRALFPIVTIEVDGGINVKTAKECIEAGANAVISASFIFDSENYEEAIATLRNI